MPAMALVRKDARPFIISVRCLRARGAARDVLLGGFPDLALGTTPAISLILTLRADFYGQALLYRPFADALQNHIENLGPMNREELRQAIIRPAENAKVSFDPGLVETLLDDVENKPGSLPLLQFALREIWGRQEKRTVTRKSYDAIGGVEGALARRADVVFAELTKKGADTKTAKTFQRLFTRLVMPGERQEDTRRVVEHKELGDEAWSLAQRLADENNRLVVVSQETAEVVHEALIRHWPELAGWINRDRAFQSWLRHTKPNIEAWSANPADDGTLLRGGMLAQAKDWLDKRRDDLSEAELAFIEASIAASERQQKKERRVHALIYGLLVGIILGLIGWINQAYLKEQMNWFITMRPYMVANFRPHVLSADRERALKPGDSFRECAKDCPEMVVVPAGEFMMGSPPGEKGRYDNEGPQHPVTIKRPFAVSKYEVTFADWDACVSVGGCPQEGRADDSGWGRGNRPVIDVSWDDAKAYVAWLSRMTGKPYRLLTEAEYEYAARAGTTTAYPWGDEIGENNANCNGCGREWLRQTAPVGSFAPNAFGLHDMLGNVWVWVEDCYHATYDGAPPDGDGRRRG